MLFRQGGLPIIRKLLTGWWGSPIIRIWPLGGHTFWWWTCCHGNQGILILHGWGLPTLTRFSSKCIQQFDPGTLQEGRNHPLIPLTLHVPKPTLSNKAKTINELFYIPNKTCLPLGALFRKSPSRPWAEVRPSLFHCSKKQQKSDSMFTYVLYLLRN